jgi:hypothetical protein
MIMSGHTEWLAAGAPGDEWRVAAADAVAGAEAMGRQLAEEAERRGAIAARVGQFTDRYTEGQDLLPMHKMAWATAGRFLREYGRELLTRSKSVFMDGGQIEHFPLSTGYLTTEDPTYYGAGGIVSVVRLSLRAGDYKKHPFPINDLEASRNARFARSRERALARAEGAIATAPYIHVEAGIAATDVNLLETHRGKLFTSRVVGESAAPVSMRLAREDHRHTDVRLADIGRYLDTKTDMNCPVVSNPVFSRNGRQVAEIDIPRPSVPQSKIQTWYRPDQHIEALEKDLAAASESLAPVRTLHNMLMTAGGPLRDLPGFARTSNRR